MVQVLMLTPSYHHHNDQPITAGLTILSTNGRPGGWLAVDGSGARSEERQGGTWWHFVVSERGQAWLDVADRDGLEILIY